MSTSSTYGAMDTFVTGTRITDVTADDFDDLMYRNTYILDPTEKEEKAKEIRSSIQSLNHQTLANMNDMQRNAIINASETHAL